MPYFLSMKKRACGLVQRGWCISEKLDGKLAHKCLHLFCRMSVVLIVSKIFCSFLFFPPLPVPPPLSHPTPPFFFLMT